MAVLAARGHLEAHLPLEGANVRVSAEDSILDRQLHVDVKIVSFALEPSVLRNNDRQIQVAVPVRRNVDDRPGVDAGRDGDLDPPLSAGRSKGDLARGTRERLFERYLEGPFDAPLRRAASAASPPRAEQVT